MQVCCFIAACDLVVIGIAVSVCQRLYLTVSIAALTIYWQADHSHSDHTSACLSSSYKWKDATRFRAELLHRGTASFQAYKHVRR